MPTRRSFLSLSAATVAGAMLPEVAVAQARGGELFTPATLGAYQQNLLSMARMEKLVGSLFMVFLETGSVAYLTLSKVKDLADLNAVPSQQPGGNKTVQSLSPIARLKASTTPATQVKGFVAVFSGETRKVPQGTYVVDHGRLGRIALLLVPGRNEAGETTVVATFTSL